MFEVSTMLAVAMLEQRLSPHCSGAAACEEVIK